MTHSLSSWSLIKAPTVGNHPFSLLFLKGGPLDSCCTGTLPGQKYVTVFGRSTSDLTGSQATLLPEPAGRDHHGHLCGDLPLNGNSAPVALKDRAQSETASTKSLICSKHLIARWECYMLFLGRRVRYHVENARNETRQGCGARICA